MKQNVFFVSGIDTDAGKSYATGFLARDWNKNGQRTITQKFIQTGNVGHSEDIDLHRRIMGISFTKEDEEGLTMPEIFSYPASPHLASQLDLSLIHICTPDTVPSNTRDTLEVCNFSISPAFMVEAAPVKLYFFAVA